MTKVYYKGYSTSNYEKNKSLSIINLDCVKEDILNHIWTIKGERVMMPNFGTRIPELVFEPMDDFVINSIESELYDVMNYDPRVELLNLKMNPLYDENMIRVDITLKYIEFDIIDNINLNIEFTSN